jgi:tRNA uridine 5-carbamoylmethylation protein Kti12
MKPPRLIIVRGLPGAGKTTFALEYIKKNPQYILIERDHFRYDRDGKYGYRIDLAAQGKEDYHITLRNLLRSTFVITCGLFQNYSQLSALLLSINHPISYTALHTITTQFESIHPIPHTLMRKMLEDFENDEKTFASLPLLRRLYAID